MEKRIEVVSEEMKLNDKLFYKMQKEQELYLKKIGNLPSQEVIKLSREINLRNVILTTMERNDLSTEAATGLLQLERPISFLSACYKQCRYASRISFHEFLQISGDILFLILVNASKEKQK